MITYSYKPLTEMKHRFRELHEITGGERDAAEYREYTIHMMNMGLNLWYAEERGRIIGTVGIMTRVGNTGYTKCAAMVQATEKLGIDPNKVQVRSMIYVDPAYRGKGLADTLEKKANRTSIDLGFEYRAAYAYQNELIYKWIHRHGNAIDLDTLEPTGTGFPATLVPLTNL